MEKPQVEIRDEDQSTEGGPPGWMAFAIIVGLFLVLAAVAALVMALVFNESTPRGQRDLSPEVGFVQQVDGMHHG
jgi:hypothetical protein